MSRIVYAFTLCVLIALPSCRGPGARARRLQEEFQAVYRAAKAVQSAVDIGVTYLQYRERLLAFASELALASERGSDAESELLISYLTLAKDHYHLAGQNWNAKMETPENRFNVASDALIQENWLFAGVYMEGASRVYNGDSAAGQRHVHAALEQIAKAKREAKEAEEQARRAAEEEERRATEERERRIAEEARQEAIFREQDRLAREEADREREVWLERARKDREAEMKRQELLEREAEEQRRREDEAIRQAEEARRRQEQERQAKRTAEHKASGWPKIKKGVTREEVRRILGEPKWKESSMVSEVWMYIEKVPMGCGSVTFVGGAVESFLDPWTCF